MLQTNTNDTPVVSPSVSSPVSQPENVTMTPFSPPQVRHEVTPQEFEKMADDLQKIEIYKDETGSFPYEHTVGTPTHEDSSPSFNDNKLTMEVDSLAVQNDDDDFPPPGDDAHETTFDNSDSGEEGTATTPSSQGQGDTFEQSKDESPPLDGSLREGTSVASGPVVDEDSDADTLGNLQSTFLSSGSAAAFAEFDLLPGAQKERLFGQVLASVFQGVSLVANAEATTAATSSEDMENPPTDEGNAPPEEENNPPMDIDSHPPHPPVNENPTVEEANPPPVNENPTVEEANPPPVDENPTVEEANPPPVGDASMEDAVEEENDDDEIVYGGLDVDFVYWGNLEVAREAIRPPEERIEKAITMMENDKKSLQQALEVTTDPNEKDLIKMRLFLLGKFIDVYQRALDNRKISLIVMRLGKCNNHDQSVALDTAKYGNAYMMWCDDMTEVKLEHVVFVDVNEALECPGTNEFGFCPSPTLVVKNIFVEAVDLTLEHNPFVTVLIANGGAFTNYAVRAVANNGSVDVAFDQSVHPQLTSVNRRGLSYPTVRHQYVAATQWVHRVCEFLYRCGVTKKNALKDKVCPDYSPHPFVVWNPDSVVYTERDLAAAAAFSKKRSESQEGTAGGTGERAGTKKKNSLSKHVVKRTAIAPQANPNVASTVHYSLSVHGQGTQREKEVAEALFRFRPLSREDTTKVNVVLRKDGGIKIGPPVPSVEQDSYRMVALKALLVMTNWIVNEDDHVGLIRQKLLALKEADFECILAEMKRAVREAKNDVDRRAGDAIPLKASDLVCYAKMDHSYKDGRQAEKMDLKWTLASQKANLATYSAGNGRFSAEMKSACEKAVFEFAVEQLGTTVRSEFFDGFKRRFVLHNAFHEGMKKAAKDALDSILYGERDVDRDYQEEESEFETINCDQCKADCTERSWFVEDT